MAHRGKLQVTAHSSPRPMLVQPTYSLHEWHTGRGLSMRDLQEHAFCAGPAEAKATPAWHGTQKVLRRGCDGTQVVAKLAGRVS